MIVGAPPPPPAHLWAELALPEWGDRSGSVAGAPPALHAAYVWARAGRYDHAWAWWDVASDEEAAAVHAGRAAALRELGLHERAERHDEAALLLDPAAELKAQVLVGRVADAVGLGRTAESDQRLDLATAAVRALPPGLATSRQRVRLSWVRVEVGLAAGATVDVGDLPQVVDGRLRRPDDYAAGTTHHLAKGLAFRGVARRELATLDHAVRLAPDGLRWAVHLARADLGAPHALAGARAAWQQVGVPDELADAVALTATATRLR